MTKPVVAEKGTVKEITFIVPVADEQIFSECFQRSPLLSKNSPPVIVQRNFKSASAAFNDALDRATTDLIAVCHQDVILPSKWHAEVCRAIEAIETTDQRWGVIGCAGKTKDKKVAAHLYRHDRELTGEVPLPALVRTLDESVIVFRKSSGLRFDENLLGFFFYAVDICLQAEEHGMRNYAIDAPCFHQSKNRFSLSSAFFLAESVMIEKWKERLPVQTLSGTVAGRPQLIYKKVRNRTNELLAACGLKRRHWWVELPRISPEEILQ